MTGNYTIGEEIFEGCIYKGYLGEGGFGKVYLVENRIGLPRAIKVLHKDVRFEDEEKERRGVQAVMRIPSNRLIEIHDYGRTVSGEACILMEYVKDNLEKALDQLGRFEERKACRYFKEILKGLVVLEENGVVHRDIKPANLFLLEDIVKIGVYGSAKFTSGKSSRMTQAPGTMNYMAPERFKKAHGYSVDRWSAAVVFYQMLSGKHPFDGEDNTEIFGTIMQAAPELSLVPRRYRLFFSRCFQKERKNRYGNVREMLTAFNRVRLQEHSEKTLVSQKHASGNIEIQAKKPLIRLRSKPKTLSADELKAAIRRWNFFDKDFNTKGRFNNDYKEIGDGTIIDHVAGLMWQKSGSNAMDEREAEYYIKNLNRKRFAGYSDWRLPTIEELASLMEPERKNADLHIDPIFDIKQRWCLSSDQRWAGRKWSVHFCFGPVTWSSPGLPRYVRAVRFWQ